MNIFDKIEEIRHQPEHVRLRWVWGLTAGCMTIVIILWVILIKGQTSNFSQGLGSDNSNFSTEFDQQKKSIKDATGQITGTLNNVTQQGISAMGNNSTGIPTDFGEGFTPEISSN